MNSLEYATLKHKGQKRKDGKEYITHPIAVSEIAASIAGDYFATRIEGKDTMEAHWFYDSYNGLDHFRQCAVDAGLLHDTVEDTDATIEELESLFDFNVVTAIKLVTKKEGENYFDFTYRIAQSKFKLAMIVKLADLTHNMSDLNEGSMKDKYRFAKMVIFNALFNV